jgi:hypothetical protein
LIMQCLHLHCRINWLLHLNSDGGSTERNQFIHHSVYSPKSIYNGL